MSEKKGNGKGQLPQTCLYRLSDGVVPLGKEKLKLPSWGDPTLVASRELGRGLAGEEKRRTQAVETDVTLAGTVQR